MNTTEIMPNIFQVMLLIARFYSTRITNNEKSMISSKTKHPKQHPGRLLLFSSFFGYCNDYTQLGPLETASFYCQHLFTLTQVRPSSCLGWDVPWELQQTVLGFTHTHFVGHNLPLGRRTW